MTAVADSSTEIDTMIEQWALAPDISARSVLATVFGDTILPVTKSFWLAQLFKLTEAIGFNDRLIRTSMFRLAEDNWLTNERVGRQSRYTLTAHAISESELASQRIYHQVAPDWSGSWALVIFDRSGESDQREELVKHLTWSGFIRLGADLMASPAAESTMIDQLMARIGSTVPVAVANAEFVDLEKLVGSGFFAKAFSTETTEADYRRLMARYQPLSDMIPRCSPLQAFAIRTMLIHDLRRIRLRAPDMPVELLPTDWIGDSAQALAAELYGPLSARCAEGLSSVLELDYPTSIANRF